MDIYGYHTFTYGYLSPGAPAPDIVWELCACVSGVLPVCPPVFLRLPTSACPCDSVCTYDLVNP